MKSLALALAGIGIIAGIAIRKLLEIVGTSLYEQQRKPKNTKEKLT